MRLLKPSTFTNEKVIQLMPSNGSTSSFFDILNDVAAYVEYYKEQYILICLDDFIVDKPELLNGFVEDLVLLKRLGINLIVIHDAHTSIGKYSKLYGVDLEFNNETQEIPFSKIEFVEMVLHSVNQNIVSRINACGGRAIGISGKDGGLVEAVSIGTKKKDHLSKVHAMPEINCFGKVIALDTAIIPVLESTDAIPVLASTAFNDNCKTLYVDAIDLTKNLSRHLSASTTVFQVDGWIDEIANNCLDSEISLFDFKVGTSKLLMNEVNKKVEVVSQMLEEMTDSAHFINYNINHSLIFDLLSERKTGCVVY